MSLRDGRIASHRIRSFSLVNGIPIDLVERTDSDKNQTNTFHETCGNDNASAQIGIGQNRRMFSAFQSCFIKHLRSVGHTTITI